MKSNLKTLIVTELEYPAFYGHYGVHNEPLLDRPPSQLNPVHTLAPYPFIYVLISTLFLRLVLPDILRQI
jgi:hypothetical protein